MKFAFEKKETAQIVVVFAGTKDNELVLSPPAAKFDRLSKKRISTAANAARFKGGASSVVTIHSPANGVDICLLVGVGEMSKINGDVIERAAAAAAKAVLTLGPSDMLIKLDGWGKFASGENAARAAFGVGLASYRFDKYRTKLKAEQKPKLENIVVDVEAAKNEFVHYSALLDGVSFARDLSNEPANILNPPEFAARLRELSALGIEVTVLGEQEMLALGMGSFLGVGQGSIYPSQLVVMKYNGGADEKPLALVGKGLCFDSGGISLKPSGGMEAMKGDMGGAAAVSGAMLAIAKRKAKANVVGLVGLSENMADGNAQRPGDIVTSMSGQTIEVLNTDAEGRLVLCDVLTYAQEKFDPSCVIDVATLTGAIVISLGSEYAGIFSNNDAMADKVFKSGTISGEKVWRMPLAPAYDKLIDSPTADMKNVVQSGPGAGAGSITAAQFLQRFIKDGMAWVHVDIAGTAMKPIGDDPREPTWGTGFGVRLFDRLIKDHFEG
ncbi:MAG: leucyl aminopeptidase [Hyphomonadaceae bacterium]|nr:MAG: leucyl aminopeptidase [Hyphomonadaceae bacterium]